jgi:tRNA threonylcarbamoyladenosine biosynthesis protein TsaE
VKIATAAEMHALGTRLAAIVAPGDLLVLAGPLGAGKTALTQGIGAGLGVGRPVVSPTFVIARVHPDGRVPLVHVDAYRLSSLAEVDDMDLDVSVADSVTVIEWGSGIVEQLSDTQLRIDITRMPESEIREVELSGIGGDWAHRLRALG